MSSCVQHSKQVQEPLIGTTLEHIDRWILVEQKGQWPPRPSVDDLHIDEDKREMIVQALQEPGTRLQWIRNASTVEPRIFLCVQQQIYVADEQTKKLIPEQMKSYSTPMLLICTHGSRDRCCGTLGGAIYAKAQDIAPQQVWQASHLGGHRFAPTLLVLPAGMMYGRVEESDIPALLTHPQAYPVSCEKLRGVPRWAKEVQVAAQLVWQSKKNPIDSFSSTQTDNNTWSVSLECAAEIYNCVVTKSSMGVSALASCKDTEPKEVFRYHCLYV